MGSFSVRIPSLTGFSVTNLHTASTQFSIKYQLSRRLMPCQRLCILHSFCPVLFPTVPGRNFLCPSGIFGKEKVCSRTANIIRFTLLLCSCRFHSTPSEFSCAICAILVSWKSQYQPGTMKQCWRHFAWIKDCLRWKQVSHRKGQGLLRHWVRSFQLGLGTKEVQSGKFVEYQLYRV